MKTVVAFFSEVKLELSKVTWPNRSEVIKLTVVVLLLSGILGFYVGGLDYLFTRLLTLIVSN